MAVKVIYINSSGTLELIDSTDPKADYTSSEHDYMYLGEYEGVSYLMWVKVGSFPINQWFSKVSNDYHIEGDVIITAEKDKKEIDISSNENLLISILRKDKLARNKFGDQFIDMYGGDIVVENLIQDLETIRDLLTEKNEGKVRNLFDELYGICDQIKGLLDSDDSC